jgi:hypothetical protein
VFFVSLGSRVEGRGSRVKGQGSRVEGRCCGLCRVSCELSCVMLQLKNDKSAYQIELMRFTFSFSTCNNQYGSSRNNKDVGYLFPTARAILVGLVHKIVVK